MDLLHWHLEKQAASKLRAMAKLVELFGNEKPLAQFFKNHVYPPGCSAVRGENYRAFQLMLGNKPAGMVAGVNGPVGFHINQMEILPQYQKLNLGKKMLGELMHQAPKGQLAANCFTEQGAGLFDRMGQQAKDYVLQKSPYMSHNKFGNRTLDRDRLEAVGKRVANRWGESDALQNILKGEEAPGPQIPQAATQKWFGERPHVGHSTFLSPPTMALKARFPLQPPGGTELP
jgi:hypothetical protein